VFSPTAPLIHRRITRRGLVAGLLFLAASEADVPATEVAVVTPLGEIRVELFEDKPITVENFLAYLSDGRYQDSIAHRLVRGFVLQGGGYTLPGGPPIISVPTYPQIVNEFGVGQFRSNVFGTIAMAKLSGNPDSATSQWFFNLGDNSADLDFQNGGFTVFGQVVAGLDVLTLFNTTFNQGFFGGPGVYNASSTLGSAFGTLPLLAGSLNPNNFIYTDWSIVTQTAYWKGGTDGQWTHPANFGTSRTANYTFTNPVNATTDVVFNADAAANFANTVLGGDQTIRTLTLSADSAVGIGGAHTLTIIPGAPGVGITVPAGAPGPLTHAIGSAVVLGAAQTWTVSAADHTLVVSGPVGGAFPLTKAGSGVLNLDGSQTYATLTASGGTTNINGPLSPSATVAVSPGAVVRFGTVSQTLDALTVGAGATVVFSSGTATGAFGGGEKGGTFGGAGAVPEPGTFGLLLAGALGILGRRQRRR
jgi:cyclophilin family peptidyl-prolyl cis-trans isomerase